MVNVASLFHLMWHQFVWSTQASDSVIICHCWPIDAQLKFAHLAAQHNLYTRYLNLLAYDRTNSSNSNYNSSNNNNHVFDDFAVEFLRHQKPIMGVLLDWQCGERAMGVVSAAAHAGFFNSKFSWLIYDGSADLERFRQHFARINLGVDTQLTYVMATRGSTEHFTLYDVYNNGWYLGGRLNMTIDREFSCNGTSCKLTQFLSTLHERTKYRQRERLRDIRLRVAIVLTSMPLNTSEERIIAHLNADNNKEIDPLQRLAFRMLLMMQEMLVSKMQYHFTNAWSIDERGIIGGCVGSLINRSVDLCGTPFAITKVRMTYIKPMVEGSIFRPICMFRTPRNMATIEASVILAPFTAPVWQFFGCLLLLAAVLMWCAFRVEQRLQRLQDFVPSLITTCLMTIGTACVQGSPLQPRSCGGRMISFTLLLICYLTYNYYTSAVVSTLLGAPVKSNIKTLRQLADSNLPVGVEPIIHNLIYFNISTLADVQRFTKRKITQQTGRVWFPLLEGILRVRDQPGFVYVFEASSSYGLVERNYEQHQICDLNEFIYRPERSLYTHIHRNSSYKELIHLKQLRIIETGVFDKHRRYWQQSKLHCFANNILIDVGFQYTAPLFLMLLCAYILSWCVLLVELLVHRKWTQAQARTRIRTRQQQQQQQCQSESDVSL